MMRKWLLGLVICGLMVWLAGCGHVGKEPGPRQEPAVQQNREPLTGLPTKNRDPMILMVMINNHHQARPQTGLGRADWVYEILAEGEITRFAAFYHSETSGVVGPVRSVREYYLDLAKGLHAVVAHAGGATNAMETIKQEGLHHLDGIHEDSRYFWRVGFRKPPHNLYTDLSKLVQGARSKGYHTAPLHLPLTFSAHGATDSGKPAEQIHIVYHRLYSCGYAYDSGQQAYVRFTQGEKQVDRESGQPLTMQNVLVIRAKHHIFDSAGHREVDLSGSGDGYLFQKGKAIPIRWENRSGVIVPTVHGKIVSLVPGKTWVNVIPENGKVTFQ
ncbi:DUF3048 domain-containing protein [Polycladomyces subterraneus]|uniref:DUF3048 domain-containing protein n=1 Tax=Polycladomyces subterraneus TaxID=1016997 RepID=A0ABT8IPC3_9BACL|nr:DUF3048 domain-containing protein [Polycladomyces subterraneus]MDN4594650.1 DUF3048 domain-containing protein [Polycladomyces subterraneus]